MIGFEGKLPTLAATFKRLVPDTMVTSEGHLAIPRPTSTSPVSAHPDVGIDTNEKTVLVQGLTWADTVDLTFSPEQDSFPG